MRIIEKIYVSLHFPLVVHYCLVAKILMAYHANINVKAKKREKETKQQEEKLK